MQNDMLKNNIAPWQEKGRWYHGVYVYGSGLDATRSDQFLVDKATFPLLASVVTMYIDGLHNIMDIKVKSKDLVVASASTLTYTGRRYYAGSSVGYAVLIGPPASSGELEFWAFIVKN